VCCFPPCGVSPRGVWGLCPLRSSDDAFFMMMSPHAEPTPGCSAPDSGWQSAAARPGTTLSAPAPGRPPGHHHIGSALSLRSADAEQSVYDQRKSRIHGDGSERGEGTRPRPRASSYKGNTQRGERCSVCVEWRTLMSILVDTRSEEINTAFDSYLACFVNTYNSHMYVCMEMGVDQVRELGYRSERAPGNVKGRVTPPNPSLSPACVERQCE